jgi:plastocyanin
MKRLVTAIIVILVVVAAILGLYTLKGGKLVPAPSPSPSPASTPSPTSSPSSTPVSSTSPSPSQNPSQAGQTASSVSITNFAFNPATVTVKKGTVVTWTNRDSAGHSVTETDTQAGPGSNVLAQGKSYSFTFEQTGTFHYHCSVHPDMIGTVIVTD